MTHEEIKAALSAFHDGELPAHEAVAVSAHVRSCAECSAALEQLGALSSASRASLAAAAPAALKARVLAAAAPKKRVRAAALLAGAFAALLLGLMALFAAKRFAPVMFAQIQGMINGAASTLGASGGNQ